MAPIKGDNCWMFLISYNTCPGNRAELFSTTAKLWYFELPVLLNNGKWPSYNQCK